MSFNAAAAFSCDTGGLGQSTCTITNAHDITSEVVTDSNTDIIVDSGGRLYTNHVNQTNANDAKISLTNGDFIVKAGGAVHANINISAYNIKVEKGGVIDATGLGWQAAASGSSSCKFGTSPDGYCLGGGPAGGSGGDGNSNTGAGGAGYGGKGGSYVDSSVSYTATGGGRGSVNNETYGNPENPTSFGSGGGAEGSSGPETIVGIESTRGHGMASNYPNGSDLQRLINNATYGDGDTDDPDDDPVDGDRWISTGKEYRKNNPYDILMGSGGGRIKLVGSNKINISGYVLSNGLDAGGTSNNGYPMGAGSGGSILISAGGIFGSGTIRADGGSYSEWLDGDDANTGSSGVSGGGGGGRIYYEYSIAEKNWTVTAERGIGNVNSSEGFAKNTNKQDSGHRDEHSTDGTIRSQIAFSANVNDTIINPNGPMKVNGTASSNVTVKINGTKVGETEPRASDGFYNLTVEGMDINETKNFGNYTMEVSSTISGNTITETFQISHRTLKIDQSSDYILKPGEQFTAEGLIQKVKEDGSGGSKKVDFSNENFFFNLSSGNNDLSSTTLTTNSTGGFKLTETVPTTKGRKYYTTKAENSGGIEGFDRKNISWMKLNDSIVDPGQYIQVNGTAYSPVYIYLENQSGRKEFRAKVNPNSNGYFSYSLKSLQIQNKSKLGNYTITVKTKLNGKNRTEKFNISYREIEIDNKPDFLLKPGEDLQFSNFTDIIKEDGSGGAKKVDYAGETLTFSYLNQSSTLNSTDIITNSTGGFSVFHNLEPTPGLKRFTLETKNENGITDTVQDNDLKNINNRTLAWTGIDDYIVNSGGKIKVNGSAYNKVELIFNGTTVNNSVNPDPENGFFRSKFSVPEIQDTEAFGNYTLGINTSLNGKELSEKFEVSIRGIRFNLTRDYPVRVDPGENFTVSGQAVKYIPNGSGGSKAVNYSNEKIKIVYRDQFGEIQTKTTTTNSSGEFKIENFKSPLNAGDRIIEISTVNSEGIRHERIKTIKTRIRVENSSTTSPSLRLFKDSNLEQTRFINPTQEVDFSVKTRKSLDFVKEVYANVTLPNGSLKQVELNAKGVLGKRLNSASEWDSGDTSHLTHRDTLGNLYADRLRLGYEPEDSDNVILSFPMETGSGKVKDTSGRNHDAIISGTVNRLKSGVFSTNATELAGGTLRIDNRSAVNLASNFTLTTWIKTSDSGAIYSRASNDEANINPELRITSSGKALIQIASGGTATTVNSSTSVDDSKWHQVTGRYNTTHLSIYVDGQIEQTTTVNSEISKFQRDPIIGDSGTFNDRPFAGKIDNLRVHNKSLSNSKISDIGSRKGTFESSTITTEKEVKDILKLLNFKGDLNNQEISIQVFSDYNSDSTFEENSTVINLSDGTEIRSVKGFKNSSKKFKLQFNFSTANASKSPLLDEIDFKARKDSTITWSKHKSVQNFFNEQYGTYKVDYGARDYGGNVEDTTLEESNFTVRDIVLKADHTKKKNPGENLKITGNATLVKGDGNGGKSKSDFTGKLNVLLNDTIRGKNSVNESILFKSVSTGSSGEVRVNGSLSPANTQVTFYGDYSGTDETLVWNSSTDWDSYQSRTGTSHSLKIDSALSNKSLTLGYPSQDLGGSALESYYAMDDNSAPLDDSMKKRSFEKVGTPEFGKKGILSTEAVKLSGSDGFNATSPFTKKGSFTINAWVKPESIPSSSGHLGTGTGDPYTVFAIKDKLALQIVEGGNVYAEANVSGQNYSVKTTSGNVKADEWTMISLVYNTGDDSFAVSTGQGGDSASTTITTTPDLTSKKAFIGYRSDIDSNGFKGKIDELRIYSRDAIPFNLRNLAGDKSEQQKIITGKKSFSETVKTGSLVLEADIEKKGQPVRVTVRSNAGGTSDTIQLQDGSKRYQITGSMADAQKYSLKVEMDSNVTNTAKIKQLKLVRRYATENPEIDLDGDTNPEANFTGRILEGEKKTVDLENLSTGINNVNFSSKNGIYDARINYTEKLAENNYDQVDLNSTGDFSTNFTVPKFSGKTVIDYYTTNERGIQGITNTTLTSSLLFNNESVEDLENGDRTVDPKNLFQVNASLNPHKNDIERMWAVIATPGGNSYERNFSKYSQNWRFKENTSEIFDKEGNYTADLHVRDTEGLRELESPMISFNVTNGTISASPVDATVGLNREFTVNGTVRQNLSGQRVNASVNITLPYTGETKIVDTNSSGEYSVTLQSPSQTGNYTVKVNSEDEDNITASNSTKIQIKDTTSISLGVPDVVPATNVGTEEGQNKTFTVNITNTGDTDARNIKVFSINLPTVNGGKWISLNHTFNVSSGEKKQATGEVWIKAGAPFGTYDSMSIVAKFNESDGTTTNSTVGYSIEVKPNKRPLWQNNKSVTRNEGFSGSLLNSSNELELKNTGTSTANGVTWNLSDSRIKSWTKIYKPRQNPGDRLSKSNLGSGEKLNLFNMTVDIPNGTAPGNYSVLLESDSDDPTATNDANLTVEVPNKPTFNLTFKPTKKDVKIPSGEINMSNPIQMGTMATGTTAERLFNITLNNNGNRDLEWTANREQSGERRIYFNKSDVGTAEVGTEVRESDIGLKNQQNYTYKVPDKIMPVYYKVASTASAETYRANVTITCRYPIGDTNLCDYPNFNGKSKFIKRNGKIILPLNGTVEDPKAEFTDLGVKPSTTGVEDPVTVSATVEDNKQTYLTENDSINASIKKNINDTMVIVKKKNLDIKFGGEVDFNFKPTKEFDEGTSDNQEPDYYCVSFTVEDSSGQKTTSKCTDFKVKESASPDISRDSTSITLENVTATSGDSEYITGKVKGGNVKARNLNISFSTDAPSKFSFSNSKLETGDLAPGKNASFNVTMNSVENIDPLKRFTAFITTEWVDPDGSSRQPDYETQTKEVEINIEANKRAKVSHGSSDSITVSHNSTGTETFKIESEGNSKISNVKLSSVQSGSEIFISGFNKSGFDLGPGKTVTVAYNVTVDKYVSPQTVARDIKISYDSGTKYLNDTVVTVPEEKAIKTSPDNISAAIPVNQGDVNITSITTKNIGNADVTLEFSSNDTGAEVYFGSSKLNKYSVTISPGNTDSVKARSDTSALELGEHLYKVKPVPSSGSLDQKDPINLTVFAQDIGFEIKNQNKTTDIVAGDQIETSFNLTQKGKAINSSENVDIKLLSGDSTYDIEETFSNSSKLWTANFQAPDIEDGINHTFKYEVSSSAFKSKLSASKEVNYKDVTPPKFVNLTAEPVKSGENSTIKVKLKDKSDIIGEDVTANILTPDGSSSQLRLDPVGSTRLSETQSKKWVGEFNATTRKGLYNVTVKATDSAGNTGESGSEYFRVFQPLNVSGDAADPANSTEIRLIDEGGDVAEKVDPENGRYNETIKSGTYSEVEVQFTKDKIASLESLSAGRINRSPPKFDARINENRLNVDKQYLSGFALVSKTFDNVSGELSFDYSDYIDRIDYQGNLQVMKCEEYNISKARPCQSSYETISKNNTFINAKTRNLYINNISGFSSYILVEDESSSQSNNLNVNLTGELGNFSDLSNLDSLLQQVASNTQNLGSGGGSSGGGSTGSGSGSGGGGSGSSGGGGLGQLASQLNKSEDKLAIGNSKISVNIQPGQKKSTAISIQNPKDKSVNISLEATRNIREMLSFNKSFDLKSGEFRTVKITVDASNKSKLKEFSGFIQVKGDSSDRSIPVNIDIVGADKRLLDVSLQPTVDSFRPGKTARIKLSFSNQGFTRAVDAETTISIVDITDDEVIAKETHTYAVQTTLDKVVSLEIPKGTDLGTYEARATVEYSNIPGNRSATAVGQVEVQRPFWQRQTLGLANVYWLGIVLLLIAAGSGGGYWYYRKKKLEAKRSRFEEQVDNDAIPSEAGRTAFVGELSEIGTRAFIDLNDLMTHCLTAGATGAGKSVAAQVIVEEALEQGVNVIVLDPTGQWSGYLDKNENDEFFAFYDDFGMKESDARSYQGNIRAVDADQDTIDITDIMRPEGDEGSIHVFSMHKLENAELEEYLSDTIQQIFDYNPEEKDELKTLIVYDEAHRVLEKFGGTGRGVKMLERGAREFRKWGTGMLMISQVIDDFPEEVRANIGTQIQMRTEYEGDLDRIERKYGNNITQGVTKADTGTGMLQNSSYNHGRPYFVDFRPVKHSPERLSDEELDKFEKYNRRVDELEDMISILEDQGEDVFEYESQLKLVKKNIRKRSFNLVDTYLDELEEDLNDALDL